MDNMEQFRKVGVVPVVVLEHAEQAVDTAKALLASATARRSSSPSACPPSHAHDR